MSRENGFIALYSLHRIATLSEAGPTKRPTRHPGLVPDEVNAPLSVYSFL